MEFISAISISLIILLITFDEINCSPTKQRQDVESASPKNPPKAFADFHCEIFRVIEGVSKSYIQLLKDNKDGVNPITAGNAKLGYDEEIFAIFENNLIDEMENESGSNVDKSTLRASFIQAFAPARPLLLIRLWLIRNMYALTACTKGECGLLEFEDDDLQRMRDLIDRSATIYEKMGREAIPELIRLVKEPGMAEIYDKFLPNLEAWPKYLYHGNTTIGRRLHIDIPRDIQYSEKLNNGKSKNYEVKFNLKSDMKASVENFVDFFEAYLPHLRSVLKENSKDKNAFKFEQFTIRPTIELLNVLKNKEKTATEELLADKAMTTDKIKKFRAVKNVPQDVLLALTVLRNFTGMVRDSYDDLNGNAEQDEDPDHKILNRLQAIDNDIEVLRNSAIDTLKVPAEDAVFVPFVEKTFDIEAYLRVPGDFGVHNQDPQRVEIDTVVDE